MTLSTSIISIDVFKRQSGNWNLCRESSKSLWSCPCWVRIQKYNNISKMCIKWLCLLNDIYTEHLNQYTIWQRSNQTTNQKNRKIIYHINIKLHQACKKYSKSIHMICILVPQFSTLINNKVIRSADSN